MLPAATLHAAGAWRNSAGRFALCVSLIARCSCPPREPTFAGGAASKGQRRTGSLLNADADSYMMIASRPAHSLIQPFRVFVSRFTTDLQTFLEELKRRHVVRAATAYAVAAFVVLQAADLIFEGLMAPDWIYRVLTIVTVVGFPIVLVVAWVYEWTSKGLAADPADETPAQRASGRVRAYAFAALGVVIAIVTLGLTVPYVSNARGAAAGSAAPGAGSSGGAVRTVASAELDEDVIAVLPFDHLTAAGDDDGFGAGLMEDIITALTAIDGLDVVSRTTSLGYRGTAKAIPAIAAELGAGLILEGTVRRAGDMVRVTAQLIDTRTDTHLWAESYDRRMDDVFQIQSELAQAIATAVQVVLEPASQDEAMRRLAANDVYLRGRMFLREGSPIGGAAAEEAFRQALEANPDMAGARAGLAQALTLQSVQGQPALLDSAAAYAESAVQSDPRLPEARAALAMVLLAQGDVEGARSELREASRLSARDSVARRTWTARVKEMIEPYRELEVFESQLEVLDLELDPAAPRGREQVR